VVASSQWLGDIIVDAFGFRVCVLALEQHSKIRGAPLS
jgi:hypothetical protein